MRNILLLPFVALGLSLTGAKSLGASIQGLGDLPSGGISSEARGISADGSTVVGVSQSASGPEAFRWTLSEGMIGLGDLPGSVFNSVAWGVSADGNTIVGTGVGTGGRYEPFRWTISSGMAGLGVFGFGYDVSADGNTVVGESFFGFRWTASTGMETPIGSQVNGVSADGDTVVGRTGRAAMRWTPTRGIEILGDLQGGSEESVAWGVSADGNTVVGRGYSAHGYEAFRWTGARGMVGLGELPGGEYFSESYDVSADGETVVGMSLSGQGPEAFFWQNQVMRPLKEVLIERGIDAGEWTLREAWGISDDGTVIIGTGTNPAGQTEAWIAVIPEPSTFLLAGLAACVWLTRRRIGSAVTRSSAGERYRPG